MNVSNLVDRATTDIANAPNIDSLEKTRVKYLGRNGEITQLLRALKTVSQAERPKVGAAIHAAKKSIENTLSDRLTELEALRQRALTSEAKIDFSLPSRSHFRGSLHPVTHSLALIEDILVRANFKVAQGPEIEDEYHNFEALNIPPNHPARAMHDTFFLKNGMVLRTHTSPVQIRTMEKEQPPIRIICPGRVYRRDFDRTHTPMFHQVEGLVVDKGINFAHLKATVINFVEAFFERRVDIRFRASYFPFTEPSAEVDVLGENGWQEVMGCGVVHPNVLSMSGIDPKKYSGFAFGFGADRLAMLKYNIPDLRMLFDNDLRFLRQFG